MYIYIYYAHEYNKNTYTLKETLFFEGGCWISPTMTHLFLCPLELTVGVCPGSDCAIWIHLMFSCIPISVGWGAPEPWNINAVTPCLHHTNHCPIVNISSSLGSITQFMFLQTIHCWLNIPMLKPPAGPASTSKPASCSIESAFCRPHIIPELLQVAPHVFEVKATGHQAGKQITGWSNL